MNSKSKIPRLTILICPQCKEIPIINLSFQHPIIIHLQCKCGSSSYYLNDYFQLLQTENLTQDNCCNYEKNHKTKIANDYCINCTKWICSDCVKTHAKNNTKHLVIPFELKIDINCKKHLDNIIDYFCKVCSKGICDQCYEKHYNHLITNLNELQLIIDVDSIRKELNKAKNYISIFKNQEQQKILAECNNNKKIEQVLINYVNENFLLCKLIDIMLNTYKLLSMNKNYQILLNLSHYSKIQIVYFTEDPYNYSLQTRESRIKFFYETNYIIQTKFNLSHIKNINTISFGHCSILDACVMIDGRIASVHQDNSLRISNLINYITELTIKDAHKGEIKRINQTKNGKILTCSMDSNIKIWNIKGISFSCEATLFIGCDGYYANEISNNRIVSCGTSSFPIKIWMGVPPYKCIKTLGFNGLWGQTYSAIQLRNQEILLSSSNDQTVKFWNINSKKCFKTIKYSTLFPKDPITQLENGLIGILFTPRIFFVNPINFSIELIISYGVSTYSLLFKEINGVLIFHQDNGTIVTFDVKSYQKKNVKILSEQKIQNILFLEGGRFASCSFDGTIKIFSY